MPQLSKINLYQTNWQQELSSRSTSTSMPNDNEMNKSNELMPPPHIKEVEFFTWTPYLNRKLHIAIKGETKNGFERGRSIQNRISNTELMDKSKNKQILRGTLTITKDLPKYIAHKFQNGFPDDWEMVKSIWAEFERKEKPMDFCWPQINLSTNLVNDEEPPGPSNNLIHNTLNLEKNLQVEILKLPNSEKQNFLKLLEKTRNNLIESLENYFNVIKLEYESKFQKQTASKLIQTEIFDTNTIEIQKSSSDTTDIPNKTLVKSTIRDSTIDSIKKRKILRKTNQTTSKIKHFQKDIIVDDTRNSKDSHNENNLNKSPECNQIDSRVENEINSRNNPIDLTNENNSKFSYVTENKTFKTPETSCIKRAAEKFHSPLSKRGKSSKISIKSRKSSDSSLIYQTVTPKNIMVIENNENDNKTTDSVHQNNLHKTLVAYENSSSEEDSNSETSLINTDIEIVSKQIGENREAKRMNLCESLSVERPKIIKPAQADSMASSTIIESSDREDENNSSIFAEYDDNLFTNSLIAEQKNKEKLKPPPPPPPANACKACGKMECKSVSYSLRGRPRCEPLKYWEGESLEKLVRKKDVKSKKGIRRNELERLLENLPDNIHSALDKTVEEDFDVVLDINNDSNLTQLTTYECLNE